MLVGFTEKVWVGATGAGAGVGVGAGAGAGAGAGIGEVVGPVGKSTVCLRSHPIAAKEAIKAKARNKYLTMFIHHLLR